MNENNDSQYAIFVPTRNSERWIRHFAQAYHQLGLRPVYLLDSRTTDQTGAILREEKMEVITITPKLDRVEAIVGMIADFCKSGWALRFDDDELPSRELVRWLQSNIAAIEEDLVALSRRPCVLGRDGIVRYSKAEMFYWSEQHPEILDPQVRLFRPSRVHYADSIHTPGIVIDKRVFYAPSRHFFAHFDWILRSTAERINKVREYERQTPGTLRYAKFYLPECVSPEQLRETDFETDEFRELSKALSVLRMEKLLMPSQ